MLQRCDSFELNCNINDHFPSNFNYDGKVVSEMGPGWPKQLQSTQNVQSLKIKQMHDNIVCQISLCPWSTPHLPESYYKVSPFQVSDSGSLGVVQQFWKYTVATLTVQLGEIFILRGILFKTQGKHFEFDRKCFTQVLIFCQCDSITAISCGVTFLIRSPKMAYNYT